jgi:hypothetical protein
MADDARISTAIRNHPKTRKLQKRLGKEGVLSLFYLFLYAAESQPDGNLAGMSDEDIEIACDWDGPEGQFIASLVEVRFIDGESKNYQIHDWDEHNPWAASRGVRLAAAKRAARIRWDAVRNALECEAHAEGMRDAQKGNAHHPTQPNLKAEIDIEASHIADIYKPYPRKVGRPNALKAIRGAIVRLLNGESGNPISNVDEAVVYLCQRTAIFARSPAGNNGQYTPHPATWFNQSRYLDDESEWSKTGVGNGQNQQKRTDSLGKQADRNEANKDAILVGIFGGNARGNAAHGGGTVKNDSDGSGVCNVGATGQRLLT